ncbi:hypothetical protein [Megasphaera sp.]|uniref:hypothetical protein n=1 Tax=Megasphaera sp. TaxID=2023260 RepID=UPI00266C1764|nr:hypothetical protein [uncultured Megasphaera sp.]
MAKITDILSPPAIQQMMESMEKISQMVDPPAIRAMQDSMNVIAKLNPACNLSWPDAFNVISQIPLDVRTDLAESFLQQLDPDEIPHTDVPDVTEEQEKQIDELFPTLKEKSLSYDRIIQLIGILIAALSIIVATQAHNDAIQAHEDAVQAHKDFFQSQNIDSTKAALQAQISKNISSDDANDDD